MTSLIRCISNPSACGIEGNGNQFIALCRKWVTMYFALVSNNPVTYLDNLSGSSRDGDVNMPLGHYGGAMHCWDRFIGGTSGASLFSRKNHKNQMEQMGIHYSSLRQIAYKRLRLNLPTLSGVMSQSRKIDWD